MHLLRLELVVLFWITVWSLGSNDNILGVLGEGKNKEGLGFISDIWA